MCLGVIREKQSSYLAVRPKSDATRSSLASTPLTTCPPSSVYLHLKYEKITFRHFNRNTMMECQFKGPRTTTQMGSSTVRRELKSVKNYGPKINLPEVPNITSNLKQCISFVYVFLVWPILRDKNVSFYEKPK